MIKKAAKELLANFGLAIRRDKSLIRNDLKSFFIPRNEWELRNSGYYLKLLDITVPDKTSPLLAGYRHARKIANEGIGKFFYDGEGCLQIKIANTFFYIHTAEELFVIDEVFISGEYNFRTTQSIVVIDIGMNVGITSLFFSGFENVKRIYAYELFAPTYRTAMENLSLNDSSKIVSFNVGLGNGQKEMQLPYSFKNKARMGFHGLPPHEHFDDVIRETVWIKDVATEFFEIDKLEPGITKLCKMDCEGAEFEILSHLFATGEINLIHTYMIEWHDRDPSDIVRQFLENGFDVIKTTGQHLTTGLIYAIKQRKG